MVILFWIGLGSGLGGAFRYLLELFITQFGSGAFFSTLLVNGTGSFLIGWLAGFRTTTRSTFDSYKWHFWTTGICGGYTTFSVFSRQIVEAVQSGQLLVAGLHIFGNVGFGLIAVWLGFFLAARKRSITEELESPIQFYNPATFTLETEKIYGEGFLRWAYNNAIGRLTIAVVLKRFWFSRWYGWRMNQLKSRSKIVSFIEEFEIDTSEFEDSIESYLTFNKFFYRKLKTAARPISKSESVSIFPADGRHLAIADVSTTDLFYIKGQRFNLSSFIGDVGLAKEFTGGSILISRLCPVDCHRFHFPVEGVAEAAKCLAGSLCSVSPLALRRQLSILWENRRERTVIESDLFGKILFFEVGATCVGGIHQTYLPGSVSKGTEKGYFSFGGSCIVTLFRKNAVRFDATLLQYSAQGIEVYSRMGERCGEACFK